MNTPATNPVPTDVLPRPQSTPRRRWWVSVGLASVIFVSGAITGAGLATLVIRNVLHHFLHHSDKIPDAVLPRLKRYLALTNEQFVSVDQIIRRHHENLQTIRRDAVPRIQREFDDLDREMNEVLNEKQRSGWKRGFQRTRRMWFPLTETTNGSD